MRAQRYQWVYDYSNDEGSVANIRVFAKTSKGSPDRLEASRDGNLHAAISGGSRVDVFSSDGDLVV
ncbi:SMP-30/gluconolactonase/LRE family protein [Rhizobium wenxiniae]|uniref:SMP-30/gluconolactonase/LRE family protein n=1 Tax=Rhizobium wenxiniae TaxID=1737357 RepID=UPI001CB79D06